MPYINFPPIQSGTTFVYEFPIRQSGTYWYHSLSNLQEQSGVYGAIVIDPKQEHSHKKVDGDHVILFSDWTTEDPHQVLRSLKRGSEWYAIEKGSGQSIIGAARMGMLDEYFKREFQRMPAMDIADVAYDYFLANGRPETSVGADGGQTLRLRLINGSATTYFHLEFAGGPMTIVSADGLAVQPVEQQRFLIAVAETYDVLVQMPHEGSYELRATAHDGSGYSSVWLGSGRRVQAPEVPKPNLYQGMRHGGTSSFLALTPAGAMGMPDSRVKAGEFDQPGMAGMKAMHKEAGHEMPHTEHAPKTTKEMRHDMPSDHLKHQMKTPKSDHLLSKSQKCARGGKSFQKIYAHWHRMFRPCRKSLRTAWTPGAHGRLTLNCVRFSQQPSTAISRYAKFDSRLMGTWSVMCGF